MKHFVHKATALMAFAMAALTTMAQTWAPPTRPERPAFPDLKYPELPIADLEYGSAYYIRNVATGQFITGANAWGTQISVTEDMLPYASFVISDIETSTIADRADYPGCCLISLNGTHYFSGYKPNGDYLDNREFKGGTYMFRETETTGQLDRRSQVCYYWKIVKVGDYYRIQSAPGLGGFNPNGDQWIYDQGAGKPVLLNGTEDTPGIDWQFVPFDALDREEFRAQAEAYNEQFGPLKEQYDIEFEAYQAALPLYNAKLLLYELLNDATLCEANTDAAGAVYQNPESTLEEITEAAELLRSQVRDQMLVYAKEKSSPQNPIDMTKYLLLNPAFNAGNADNWTVTEGIGQNLGYQDNTIYVNDEENIEVNQFVEAWIEAPATLGDGSISQIIYGLPSGHYRLECDAMAQNQIGMDSEDYVDVDDYQGVYLYYSDGEIVVPSDFIVKPAVVEDEYGDIELKPKHYVFEFDIDQADSIFVGILLQNANVNWVLADNFRLIAAGPSQTPPSFTALRGEYTISKKLLDSQYEGAQKTVEEALTKAADAAFDLIEAGVDPAKTDAYTAAFTTLKNARTEMQTSIDAYKRLAKFMETLYADLETYNAKAYCEPISETLEELTEQMENGFDNGTLTPTEIDETIANYGGMIAEQLSGVFNTLASKGEELKEPFEITLLFPHMSYAYGTTQTAFAGGYPANEPVWMNPDGISQFKTNYSTAEVWDKLPFEIYRDFENLPMGKYSIETHAFTRIGENQANYDNWKAGAFAEGGYAYIYAGNAKTELVNVAELAVPETDTGYAAINIDEEGNQMYVPNSQQSFYNLLNDPNSADRIEKTRVTATGIVAKEGGTLRVGIVGTDQLLPKHWVIWSGFRLYYHGSSDDVLLSALNEELTALIAQAEEESGRVNIEETTNALSTAIKTADDALAINKVETKSEAIDQLKAAIALAGQEHTIMQELMEVAGTYDEQELMSDYTDTAFPALKQEIDECIINEGVGTKTLQQVRDYIDALPAAFFRYLLSDVQLDDATTESPVEMTGLLINPDFATATTANRTAPRGWVLELETPDQGNVQSNNGGYEIWNTGGARFYQELPCLREGYWRLTVDGLFRTGTADETLKRYNAGELDVYGYLFANQDSTKLYDWFAEGQCSTEELGLGGMERVTAQQDTLYAPNSGASIQNYVSVGRYVDNTLDFQYTDGPVRLGVFKSPETTIAQDWIYIDNFRLYYLGTTPPDGVGSISLNVKAPTAIYGLDGRRQNQVQRGVNIVRMSDGTVRKVLVK